MSKRIYSVYQRKYLCGDQAVFCYSTVLARDISNVRANVLMVAPSSQFKSQISAGLIQSFNFKPPPKRKTPDPLPLSAAQIWRVPGQITAWSLVKQVPREQMQGKTWLMNDLTRTINTMKEITRNQLICFLSELISDGEAETSNFAALGKVAVRMNLIANIATVEYQKMSGILQASTLQERIFEFHYYLDRKTVRKDAEKGFPPWVGVSPPAPNKWKGVPASLKPEAESIADELIPMGYQETNTRVDELVLSWVSGHARLNGRNSPVQEDFDAFRHMMPYLARRWYDQRGNPAK